jgi:serine/threonine-protein phosphatase 2B regulatory subunit
VYFADSQDQQLQQIVDKTIMEADKDGWVLSVWMAKRHIDASDGKLSFEEFTNMVASTDIVK